jgi:hypothetical protein
MFIGLLHGIYTVEAVMAAVESGSDKTFVEIGEQWKGDRVDPIPVLWGLGRWRKDRTVTHFNGGAENDKVQRLILSMFQRIGVHGACPRCVRGRAITEYYLAAWFLYVLTSLWSEQQLTERVRDFALHKGDFNQQYYFSVSWGKRDVLLRAWEEHSEKEEPQRIWTRSNTFRTIRK